VLGTLPLRRGEGQSPDLAATMEGLAPLVDAGVTDVLVNVWAPDSVARAQDTYGELAAAFAAATG
jgi:hypothetical protein